MKCSFVLLGSSIIRILTLEFLKSSKTEGKYKFNTNITHTSIIFSANDTFVGQRELIVFKEKVHNYTNS